MKKVLFILLSLSLSYSYADSDTCYVNARNYVNTYITQNSVRAITGNILNTALNKIINSIYCLDTSGGGVSQSALNDSITAVRVIRKVDTLYRNLDSLVFKINGVRYSIKDSISNLTGYALQVSLNDSVTTLRNIRKVDTLYKNTGGDSIVFTINGLRASILDRQNTGTVTSVTASSPLASSGGSTPNVTADTSILSTKGNVTGLLLNKQDNLISGTNIKTVNSNSLLGSGNIVTPDAQTLSTSYGSDSITLSISGGNSIKFAYAVDSVGMVSTDSLITYKAGVRRSYKVGSTGGGGALSAITAATATNTIDNTNYKQRWNWSTIAGDTAFALLSNSTGAASNLQNVLTVSNSGANSNASQTTFGAKISNTKTGTSSINYGLYAKASGGGSNYSVAADGDFFCIGGKYRWQSGAYIDDGSALTLYAGTNHAVFITPTKAEGITVLTSGGTISHNFYEVSSTKAGIMMGGRYNAGTYDPFSTTNVAQIERDNGKLNFIMPTGLAGSYTPSSYIAMTIQGGTSAAAMNVGIGTSSPSSNAKLEITATTKMPLKLTPMTATQASALTAEDGGLIYVSDTNGTFTSVGFWGRENGVWVKL